MPVFLGYCAIVNPEAYDQTTVISIRTQNAISLTEKGWLHGTISEYCVYTNLTRIAVPLAHRIIPADLCRKDGPLLTFVIVISVAKSRTIRVGK